MPLQIGNSFAEMVAACRAGESLRPEAQRVCYDPFARHFLAFVAGRSAPGSSIVFNYVRKAVTDGTDVSDAATRWRVALDRRGAPVRFGIENGRSEKLLAERRG